MLVILLQDLLLDMEPVCVPDLLENVCRAPLENIWFGTGLIFHIEFYCDCWKMVWNYKVDLISLVLIIHNVIKNLNLLILLIGCLLARNEFFIQHLFKPALVVHSSTLVYLVKTFHLIRSYPEFDECKLSSFSFPYVFLHRYVLTLQEFSLVKILGHAILPKFFRKDRVQLHFLLLVSLGVYS